MSESINRRVFSTRLASLAGLAALPLAQGRGQDRDLKRDQGRDQGRREWHEGLTTDGEAIHQRVTFLARPRRVYDVLTNEQEFARMTHMIGARMGMINSRTAAISRVEGGMFSLFNGRITGRLIELVPEQRIVQAWRAQDWEPGVYSIARFEFEGRQDETTLYFDHTGFPAGQGDHLAEGWRTNYWEPMKQYLK
ncbi:MAG TPA: SRPBCC family protein [Gemmatimonadales bacterium]